MPAVLLSTDVRGLPAEARQRTLALVESESDQDLDRVHQALEFMAETRARSLEVLDRVARVGPLGEPNAEFA